MHITKSKNVYPNTIDFKEKKWYNDVSKFRFTDDSFNPEEVFQFMKKIISLCLCLIMVLTVLAGCAKEKDENDKGAYVSMYLPDAIYNFDPAYAFENESALKVVSLMFDNLFVLNENGKVKKSLAKDYKIIENEEDNEYKMIITLKQTAWSDGTAVTANDVVFAWRRLLDNTTSFDAACLLYDIKNARAAKESNCSIDDVGISAINESQVEIEFVGKIDYDQFLLNLTSPALSPLREDILGKTKDPMDWAKTPSIMEASGPFKLKTVSYEEANKGLVLERNVYYFRDVLEDELDKSVTPYRLIVDYTKTPEQIMQAYSDGSLFFVGDIPLSVRGAWKDEAEITDALSTHTYVFNQDAVIQRVDSGEGEKIFAKAEVRQALSKVINREEIVSKVVFAKAASGIVPYGVFDKDTKKDLFREEGGELISANPDVAAAQALLSTAGIDASNYKFAISVPSYDEVHMEIAKCVQAAWKSLGFQVEIKDMNVVESKEISNETQAPITGIKDDKFITAYYGKDFEVAAIDSVAKSASAFSVLAPYAKAYTGFATIDGVVATHVSGYDSAEYNEKIEAAYAATNAKERAKLLHEAETILVRDMPVIPIIFNQNATLVRKEISKYTFDYYGAPNFAKLKLKDYENYIPAEEK